MMENNNTLSEEGWARDEQIDEEKEEQPESQKLQLEETKTERQTDEKQKSVAEVDPAKERENEAKEEKPPMQKLELEEELVSETEINEEIREQIEDRKHAGGRE